MVRASGSHPQLSGRPPLTPSQRYSSRSSQLQVQEQDSESEDEIRLTSDEVDRCKDLYYSVDGMSKENLYMAFHQLGIDSPDEEEVAALFPHGGSKFLDISKFLNFVKLYKSRHLADQRANKDGDLVDAFVAMGGEKDQGGTVNTGKLRDTVKLFELTIDLEGLITELDSDQSGLLDFQEFSVLLREGALMDKTKSGANLLEMQMLASARAHAAAAAAGWKPQAKDLQSMLEARFSHRGPPGGLGAPGIQVSSRSTAAYQGVGGAGGGALASPTSLSAGHSGPAVSARFGPSPSRQNMQSKRLGGTPTTADFLVSSLDSSQGFRNAQNLLIASTPSSLPTGPQISHRPGSRGAASGGGGDVTRGSSRESKSKGSDPAEMMDFGDKPPSIVLSTPPVGKNRVNQLPLASLGAPLPNGRRVPGSTRDPVANSKNLDASASSLLQLPTTASGVGALTTRSQAQQRSYRQQQQQRLLLSNEMYSQHMAVRAEARMDFEERKKLFPGDTTRVLLGPSQLMRRQTLRRRHFGKQCTSTSTTVILPPLDFGTFALQHVAKNCRPLTSPAFMGFVESKGSGGDTARALASWNSSAFAKYGPGLAGAKK